MPLTRFLVLIMIILLRLLEAVDHSIISETLRKQPEHISCSDKWQRLIQGDFWVWLLMLIPTLELSTLSVLLCHRWIGYTFVFNNIITKGNK